MANPNIISASSVVGVTTFFSTQELQTRSTDTSSSYYQYNVPIYNPAGSGKIIKIKEIIAYAYSSSAESFSVALILDLNSTATANFKKLASTFTTINNGLNFRILNKNPTRIGAGSTTIDMEYFYIMENHGLEVYTNTSATPGNNFVSITYEEISS